MDVHKRVGRVSDFLLELRCEEIPARMQAGARADLEKLFRAELGAAGVTVGNVTVWSTPRRLALIAKGLPDATDAVRDELKGPRANAPEQALEGFLRKTGLTRDQLEERDGVVFAVIEKPGRAVADLLAEAIPAIAAKFPWPKSMRWGADSISTESLRWVRPLSGIVAILGEELVPCEIGGVPSGYATVGHRFHHPGAITIGGAHDYAEKLRACHVIVDHEERAALIRAGAAAAALGAGLALVEDEGLVTENAGLTEWPVPLLGRFDEAFLDVPPEVIQLTARVNQKYFVCQDAGGKLANAFVCTANIEAKDGGEAIVDGNRKVLAARLSDARFFWEQDRKTPLAEQAKKLERITFHEKLGTVADKVERVAKLAQWLANEGIVPNCDPALARQAAQLCKADLVTEMVGEFPELQGLMGGYYARAEGLPDAVADAIRDHYKPVGQGDEVPTAPVTVAVSLADKLDTLVGFYAIGEKPTGSKDPFALRRAALGVLRLVLTTGMRIDLNRLLRQAYFGFHYDADRQWYLYLTFVDEGAALIPAEDFRISDMVSDVLWLFSLPAHHDAFQTPWDQQQLETYARARFSPEIVCESDLLDFFADRLKVQQREAGVRHDLIDAVFALGGEDDLVRLLARVKALQSFVGTEDGTNLLAGYKRAANILKKEEWEPKPLSYTPEPAEKALIDALGQAEPKAEAAIAAEDFEAAMAALATLRAPIDTFFEEVTVNDADPDKRSHRLDLLAGFRAAVHKVADFSKIEG